MTLQGWSARAVPDVVRAAEWGTYTVAVTVGQDGMSVGGHVRVQLPDSWHAWRRNGAKGVQSHDPREANFVSARASRADAVLTCVVEGGSTDEIVKSTRTGLDGIAGRYVYVARIDLVEGALTAGDVVEIVYGDTAGGGAGFCAGLHPEGPEAVRIEICDRENAEPVQLSGTASPRLEVLASAPTEVVAYLPSTLEVGERAMLRVVLLDAEGNRVDQPDLIVGVELADGDAELAELSEYRPGPGGLEIPVVAGDCAVLRLRVAVDGIPSALSNPAWVHSDPVTERIFWGDLHSHAEHSFDAVGSTPYEYARDVSCLDFYSLTEHAEGWADGDWEWLQGQAARFNKPGVFVTILGYEATFGRPWGHHNVYFRGEDAVVLGANRGTLLDLWQALKDRQALTVPHHTGVAFSPKTAGHIPGSTSPAVDWSYHDARLRRLLEIYSGHGSSEVYDPDHDLSYERSVFSTNTSAHGPHYARDAWAREHHLGVVASSDNHRGQPGRGELGIAAVRASELTREAVFDALYERRTYGTTGVRMLMDLQVNEARMGERAPRRDENIVDIRVAGTDELAEIEVFGGPYGDIRSRKRWETHERDFAEQWMCPDFGPGLLYLRVRQRRTYRGRRSTGWTSPVWLQ